ncbi:telethonin [Ascaphus truei]|uniref:telethonin n=1 Tax=Ascaphus truei TaxID=8439 RepID=UPI003F591210
MALDTKPTINLTVLSCNVQEEDTAKKESCTWLWDDLTMESRPEERMTLSEDDFLLKEGLEKRQQTVFLVQRSLLQTIRAGRLGGEMRDYQLPYKTVLPMPLFTPSRVQAQDMLPAVALIPDEELRAKLEMIYLSGLCAEKREVAGLTSDLPQVIQPTKMQLRVSSLISPPPKLYDTARY